jgi:sterol desaturase/sphingolipid hydroxylase (fatty acid hydroxylase superfamily)
MKALVPLVRYGYAPFMILGLIGAGYLVIAGGHSYLWMAPILLTAIATAFLAERISPAHPEWNEHHGDEITNVWHWALYEIGTINGILLIPTITWLFPFQGYWPTDWPLLAQFLLAFVIADFAFMVIHYLSHRWSVLWRLHAVHHGVGRLYGFNGIVRHPLHQGIDMIVGTMPLVIIGMPVDVAVLLGLAISITLIVQHSNVDYALGPLRNWLAIGYVHHIHHVNWGKEGDCNFGLFFAHWDKLFGTFVPEPSRPIRAHDMGVDELPNFPKSSIWEQLLLPFIYHPGHGEPERYRGQEKRERQREHNNLPAPDRWHAAE